MQYAFSLCLSVGQTTDTTYELMQWFGFTKFTRKSEVSDDSGKLELECMRLAADCRQLSNEVSTSELREHFLRMAEHWTARAETAQRTNWDDGEIHQVGLRGSRTSLGTPTARHPDAR